MKEKTKITIVDNINNLISKLESDKSGQISDGCHTFDELYEYRLLYNALAFNLLYEKNFKVVKSFRHSDGEYCFDSNGEWFIIVAELPSGQISNHYRKKYWDLFQVEEVEIPMPYDGHTPKDVSDRLFEYLRPSNDSFKQILSDKLENKRKERKNLNVLNYHFGKHNLELLEKFVFIRELDISNKDEDSWYTVSKRIINTENGSVCNVYLRDGKREEDVINSDDIEFLKKEILKLLDNGNKRI